MARLGRILALVAAIMLVIGGAPAVAAAQPCDPCPPDCPMMQQFADSVADHGAAPDKGGKADNPCQQQGLACQASATMAAPVQTAVRIILASEAIDHRLAKPLAATSRPPDRSLRPPIQL